MNRRNFGRGFLMLGVSAALGACYHYGAGPVAVRRPHHGPPPHAPAHGYRHRHPGGAELIYDTGIGVYIVAGVVDHYFRDGRFYRYLDGSWTVSVGLGGPWNRVSIGAVPPGLQKKFSGRRKGGGKGRGKGRK
jgi:hypothetical protein